MRKVLLVLLALAITAPLVASCGKPAPVDQPKGPGLP